MTDETAMSGELSSSTSLLIWLAAGMPVFAVDGRYKDATGAWSLWDLLVTTNREYTVLSTAISNEVTLIFCMQISTLWPTRLFGKDGKDIKIKKDLTVWGILISHCCQNLWRVKDCHKGLRQNLS
jgi:hypothetical protein